MAPHCFVELGFTESDRSDLNDDRVLPHDCKDHKATLLLYTLYFVSVKATAQIGTLIYI